MKSQDDHRRSIRSFVRRAGRLTASQQRAIEELWPRVGVEFDNAVLDLRALFGRKAPVVLEIGFGDGETFVQQAGDHPEWDFIGVEVHEPGIGHCLIRARESGIGNMRLIRHDAIEVLRYQIPDASLRRVNLYFPDPWPKKRHHKRRIVQPSFLDLIAERLEPGGSLCIATDWDDYAQHIDLAFDESDRFICKERRVHSGEAPLGRPQTKFERRGLALGHRIRDWRFERLN